MDFILSEPVRTILLMLASAVIGFCIHSLLHKDKTSEHEFSSRTIRKGTKKLAMFSDWYEEIIRVASTPEFKAVGADFDATLSFLNVDGAPTGKQYHISAFNAEKDEPIPQDVFIEDLLVAVKLRISYRIAVDQKDIATDSITVPLNANEHERALVTGYLLSAAHDAIVKGTKSSRKKDIKTAIVALENKIVEITNNVDQNLNKIRSRLIGVKELHNETTNDK